MRCSSITSLKLKAKQHSQHKLSNKISSQEISHRAISHKMLLNKTKLTIWMTLRESILLLNSPLETSIYGSRSKHRKRTMSTSTLIPTLSQHPKRTSLLCRSPNLTMTTKSSLKRLKHNSKNKDEILRSLKSKRHPESLKREEGKVWRTRHTLSSVRIKSKSWRISIRLQRLMVCQSVIVKNWGTKSQLLRIDWKRRWRQLIWATSYKCKRIENKLSWIFSSRFLIRANILK
jgi:hypothetical protein